MKIFKFNFFNLYLKYVTMAHPTVPLCQVVRVESIYIFTEREGNVLSRNDNASCHTIVLLV